METSKKILVKKYNLLLDNKKILNNSSARTRIKKLKKLKEIILKNRVKIKEALKKDFKKNPSEVDLTEIFPVVSEINFTINNLRKWMKDEYVRTPLTLLGSKSFIRYEAKGVVLIITPWNFPINLSFISLINAVSAGNSVLIKPSEITSETSYVIKDIIEESFDEKEVSVVLGGVDLAKEILKLKFNHILFIGSPTIGSEVMKSASVHLSSVTLELGGKSPTVIDKNCDLNKAAKRVVWAKLINNGQVCIAPDYVLIHEDIKNKFIKLVINNIKKFYGDNVNNSESYCRIVNKNHFKRLKNLIDENSRKTLKFYMGERLILMKTILSLL